MEGRARELDELAVPLRHATSRPAGGLPGLCWLRGEASSRCGGIRWAVQATRYRGVLRGTRSQCRVSAEGGGR